MKWSDAEIRDQLNYNAYAAAESTTGMLCEQDEVTEWLAYQWSFEHQNNLEKMFRERDDSYHGVRFYQFIKIVQDCGFTEVYKEKFLKDDLFCIYFNYKYGVLLVFDSRKGERLESARFYYNWHPADDKNFKHLVDEGRVHGDDSSVWVGHDSARVGFKFKMQQLYKHGEFVTPWVESPELLLVPHHELAQEQLTWKDHTDLSETRACKLPTNVLDVIEGDY